jgi:hypothetical protein
VRDPSATAGTADERFLQTPIAFRFTTRNSAPTVVGPSDSIPPPPHNFYGRPPHFNATLRVSDVTQLVLRRHRGISESLEALPILDRDPSGRFELLLTGNPLIELEPSLVGPFFYQDEHHTFFVEPQMAETPFPHHDDWVIDPQGRLIPEGAAGLEAPVLVAAVPDLHISPPEVTDHLARFAFTPRTDWVTGPDTVIEFDQSPIGREGAIR